MHTHPPAPRHEDSNPPKYSRMKANIVMSRIAGFREKKEKKNRKRKSTHWHTINHWDLFEKFDLKFEPLSIKLWQNQCNCWCCTHFLQFLHILKWFCLGRNWKLVFLLGGSKTAVLWRSVESLNMELVNVMQLETWKRTVLWDLSFWPSFCAHHGRVRPQALLHDILEVLWGSGQVANPSVKMISYAQMNLSFTIWARLFLA